MSTKRANGEGTITKRKDGRWEVRYCAVEDGRWRRRCLYARTREDAFRKLRTALKGRDDGTPLPSGRATVAQFLGDWLTGATPSLRPGSIRRYRQVVEDHVVPGIGAHRIRDLQPHHVQRLYSDRIAAGLSPATVRLMHFVLHRALDQALRWGRVSRNVTDLVDIPRLPRTEAAVLSPEQVRRVLDAAGGERLEALIVLALTTGLRRGELIALRWDAVDADRRTVAVRGTMQPNGVVAEPKSTSSRRTVPLGERALDALRRHRAAQLAERLAAGPLWEDGGYIFTTEVGRPVPPMTVGRVWRRLLDRAGLPMVPFHASRHSAATVMVAAGVSPKVAAQRLGHATAALTLDRYSHVTDGLHRDAAAAIDAVLAPRPAASGAPD